MTQFSPAADASRGSAATHYRLTHIDDEALPLVVAIDGVKWVITAGGCRLARAHGMPSAPDGTGLLSWNLDGFRPPDVEPRQLVTVRDYYHHRPPGEGAIHARGWNRPVRYDVEIGEAGLTLRVRAGDGSCYSPARIFGAGRSFRFAAAPGDDASGAVAVPGLS